MKDKVPSSYIGARAAQLKRKASVTLVAKIVAAFGVEPIPPEPLVEPGYLDPANQGDYGATAYFSGKPWNALDVKSLRFHADAMYMFTPQAHQYYLPAFMVASLSDPKGADVIPDNIIFHLSQHEDKFWWERILVLTPLQRAVVAEFVESVADMEIDRSKVAAVLAGFSQASQTPNKSLERTREG